MQFLSDEWLTALADAARSRPTEHDGPLADVRLSVDQIIVGGPRWRMVVDRGDVSIERPEPGSDEADVRLTSDRATATDIAAGRRAALDAFITGDLVIGGDVRVMLDHGATLETLGDLFAAVRASTTFDVPA